ncbi:Protein of unknown function [Pyronema omphalodes CBS 100304]|uniref:Uncharacterized protein n=1 Tax=Pyronema omphalodes (strain CBS 100304) TaxID=1076935 RepID=U4LJH8_PYROM|nr:Protein of unknown function [Pyronema omphalodes CBS 100304]
MEIEFQVHTYPSFHRLLRSQNGGTRFLTLASTLYPKALSFTPIY